MGKIIKNEKGEEFIVVNGRQLKLKRVPKVEPYNPNELLEDATRHFFEKIDREIETMKKKPKVKAVDFSVEEKLQSGNYMTSEQLDEYLKNKYKDFRK